MVFAWGRLHADLRGAQAERDELARLATEGAEYGGAPGADHVVAEIEARLAALEERLPGLPPDDFVLAISPAITTEIYENATGERSRLGGLTADQALGAVRLAASVAGVAVTEEFDATMPQYTEGRDRRDDPIVHTAVVAGAPWILSQDKQHIALDHRRPTRYTGPDGGTHEAVRLGYFIRNVLCTSVHFGEDHLKAIDGALLDVAVRRFAPQPPSRA